MPVRYPTNNKILPANARASDVASAAVQEFMAAEQSRNYSAFRVQGIESILYNRLTQGRKCTCQASERALATRLDEDGKAKPGVVNEMLTGAMVFDVTPYGAKPKTVHHFDSFDDLTSPMAPRNKHQGQFDVFSAKESDFTPVHVFDNEFGLGTAPGDTYGDNGPLTVDEMESESEYDLGHAGFSDAYCGVCFGTSHVGGYSPFHAQRMVATVADVDLGLGSLDLMSRPWRADAPEFSFTTVLARGAIALDSMRVFNNNKVLNAKITIDGNPVNTLSVLKYCDGKPHLISVTLVGSSVWTHIEIQFVLSDKSAYFEFPRLKQGSDTAKLEQLEPFTILMSANVPELRAQDIVAESMFGKTLYVVDSDWHNTRNRNVIGWECQVRVLQPKEIYTILPHRGRTKTKPPTSLMQHDNGRGNFRT